MATLLKPYRTSPHNNNNSFKYKLDCGVKINPEDPDTKSWLELQSIIDHSDPEYKIFTGLLEKHKKIVVKIGSKSLEKEYIVNSTYMTSQPYVNERMRSILVDWLVNFLNLFI